MHKEKSPIPIMAIRGGVIGKQNSQSHFSNSWMLTLRSPISF